MFTPGSHSNILMKVICMGWRRPALFRRGKLDSPDHNFFSLKILKSVGRVKIKKIVLKSENGTVG